jgi:hypothetical protein
MGPDDPLWPLIYDGKMQATVAMATQGQCVSAC